MLWRPHQSGLLDGCSSFFVIRRAIFFTSSFTNKMIGNHQQDDDILRIAKNGKVAFGWLQHIISLMHILIAKGYHILNIIPCECVPGAGYFSYSIFADWKAARTVTSLPSAVSLLSLSQVWFRSNFIIFCLLQSCLFWSYTEIMRTYKAYFLSPNNLIS